LSQNFRIFFYLDLPTIISGYSIGFFEPRGKIWGNGKQCQLSRLRFSNPNHLLPFDGIGDFDCSCDSYPKTLFRFPLRRTRSRLSKDTYTPDMISDLMKILKQEAKYLLLFLRSLEKIKAFVITKDGTKSLLFKVEINKSQENAEKVDDLRINRFVFNTKLKEVYDHDKKYGIVKDISHTSIFSISITTGEEGTEKKESTRWLVSSLVGSNCEDVGAAAKEVRSFPTIGTAMEIGPGALTGNRIFCFLPLPPKIHTELPVHVHGTFSLQTDRRDLLWTSLEQQDDVKTKWNELLIEKVLPVCYEKLLTKALEINKKHPEMFYQAIPNPLVVEHTNWSSLLRPLYNAIFKKLKCFCSRSQKWVKLEDATFIPEFATSMERDPYDNSPSVTMPDVVYKVMQENYNLVEVPSFMWRALEYAGLGCSLNKLSPSLVRRELKSNKLNYFNFKRCEKLDLLSYCLSDNNYRDLNNIWLVPLANENFDCFDAKTSLFCNASPLYVCTEKCSVSLLPTGHEYIVNVLDNAELQDNLKKVALSQETRLKLLDAQSVADLLKTKCFAKYVSSSKNEFSMDELGCCDSWLSLFWNWVRHQQLSLFQNLFIVPIKTGTALKLRRLAKQGGIIYVDKSQGGIYSMVKILRKFKVACVMQEDTPYVKHKCLYQYFQNITCKGALEAINEANHYNLARVQKVLLSSDEAMVFQSFLINETSEVKGDIVSHLPIFCNTRDPDNPIPICKGKFIYEPQQNTIAPEYFPSNFTVLSTT